MTKKQRKLIETRIVLAVFLIAAVVLQDEPAIARAMFIPLLTYGMFNWQAICSLESAGPSPKEVIERSWPVRAWLISALGLQILVAAGFLMTGRDLGAYINGFWPLFAAFLMPLLPALLASQLLLYGRLGKDVDGPGAV